MPSHANPASRTTRTHKGNSPRSRSTHLLPRLCEFTVSDWYASHQVLVERLETKDGEQVNVDGVAVEDVDAGEDVLSRNVSVQALMVLQKLETELLTRRPTVLQVYFSLSAAPSQPAFHLPPWYWHLTGAAVRASNSPVGAAAAEATVAASRKILENCMFAVG